MRRLKRLVIQEAEKMADIHPEFVRATDCLLANMRPSDWEYLENFNRSIGNPDLIHHFLKLRGWIIQNYDCSMWNNTNISMPTSDLRKAVESIVDRVQRLSNDLAMLLPELTEPFSIHLIIKPQKWVDELDSWNPENTVLRPVPPRRVSYEPKGSPEEAEDKRAKIEQLEINAARLHGLLGTLSAYNLAPTIAGQDGLLEKLSLYLSERSHTLQAPRKKRKYPAWCSVASVRLEHSLNQSDFFPPKPHTKIFRVIEYTLCALADYYNLEKPTQWGKKQIETARPKRKALNR